MYMSKRCYSKKTGFVTKVYYSIDSNMDSVYSMATILTSLQSFSSILHLFTFQMPTQRVGIF